MFKSKNKKLKVTSKEELEVTKKEAVSDKPRFKKKSIFPSFSKSKEIVKQEPSLATEEDFKKLEDREIEIQKNKAKRIRERTAKREQKKIKKKFSPESNTGDPVEFLNAFWKRLIGDSPFFERPPVTESHLRKLFTTRPAFVDHFPFVDYDSENGVFLFHDEVSRGAVYEIIPKDLDARSQGEINSFCNRINEVLISSVPNADEAPYVIQMFLEDREPKNISFEMDKYVHEKMKNHKLYKAYRDMASEHFSMMSNPNGIFLDNRIEGGEKGWRAIDRKLTLVIFRKATKAQWYKGKPANATTTQIFLRDIRMLIEGLRSLECQVTQYNDQDLYKWLSPWFNPNPVGSDLTSVQWCEENPLENEESERGASWDLAQIICPEPPTPIDHEDAKRGIVKFGNQYSRYMTLQPIYSIPRRGIYTTDVVNIDSNEIKASIWDKIPSQSIMTWTIIPIAQDKVMNHLEGLEEKCKKDSASSSNAHLMREQITPAKTHLIADTQRIYHFQAGIYIKAETINELDEKYYSALATLESASVMRPIQQEHDLLPFDSYIRNMPFVYDPKHDQKYGLRSFLTYTGHISAVLPLYGRSRGSKNPCFVNYNRSGEIIRVNPYSKDDKSRVSHSIVFGPTGSGKSATQVGQSLSSMAMNYPRQFFIDKGGSFELLADFYEKNGLQVRRIYFQASSDVSLPPFAETSQALKEFRGELVYEADLDDEEKRSYIGEMLSAITLMITGGNERQMENVTQQDRAYLQQALLAALELSEEQGEDHARPSHLVTVLDDISRKERDENPKISDRLKEFSDSIKLYTQGSRGHFFNRPGKGFDDKDDVVMLELGILTQEGSEDMLALAMSSLITAITQIGEKHQFSGRQNEVYMDECHYITANPLLVESVVVGVKVWRKINIWLNLATQNITDFPDHAGKILSLLEFWWLLTMSAEEATKVQKLKELSDESQRIIKQCVKAPPYYVEGVLISEKYKQGMLIRLVPPALALALGMTDGDEKKQIQDICDEQGISKLDAAIQISRNIVERRKTFSPGYITN